MSYFGGKGQDGVYQTIINQIPLHKLYREGFFGGGAIYDKFNSSTLHPVSEIAYNNCIIDELEGLYKSGEDKVEDSFTYLDPPYMLETRKSRTRYKFEMTDDDHERLLTIIKNLNCRVAISTYPVPLYKNMLSDWRYIEFPSVDRGGNVRTEQLYMNYAEPEVLHDDRYLGRNKCIRQQIKRQVSNNVNKLSKWDSRQRARFLKELLPHLTDSEKQLLSSAVGSHCA